MLRCTGCLTEAAVPARGTLGVFLDVGGRIATDVAGRAGCAEDSLLRAC